MPSFSTKKGDFAASIAKNCVLGNYWQRIFKCLSIIWHLWNSLWKKWTTVNLSLVTQFRNSSSLIYTNNSKIYLSILSNISLLLPFMRHQILLHAHSLLFHLPHNLFSLFIFELVELIGVALSSSSSFFLALFFLLHDDLVADDFLHDLKVN